jgi:guanylate kinase
MAEEKSFKEQIAEKSQNKSFLKKKEEVEPETKKEVPKDSIESMTTQEIFQYILERVVEERTNLIIQRASEEYKELSKRITEAKARIEVSNLLKDVIQNKLIAAQGMDRIPKRKTNQ